MLWHQWRGTQPELNNKPIETTGFKWTGLNPRRTQHTPLCLQQDCRTSWRHGCSSDCLIFNTNMLEKTFPKQLVRDIIAVIVSPPYTCNISVKRTQRKIKHFLCFLSDRCPSFEMCTSVRTQVSVKIQLNIWLCMLNETSNSCTR